jgi:hypothetical protein
VRHRSAEDRRDAFAARALDAAAVPLDRAPRLLELALFEAGERLGIDVRGRGVSGHQDGDELAHLPRWALR